MNRKKVLAVLLAGVLVFSLAACGSDGETEDAAAPAEEQEEDGEADDGTADAEEVDEDEGEAEAVPEFAGLTYDVEAQEITFTAEVNGTYFTEPTRHAMSFKGGGNGESSILRANPDNVDFHDALVEIGAVAGNNVAMDDMGSDPEDNVVNEGDALEFFISWEESDGTLTEEIPFEDVLTASDDFEWKVVFAGNREAAEDTGAGCFLCVDSCAAGIATNSALPVGATGDDGIKFYGNEEVLPEDGTEVTIVVRLVK